MVLGEVVPIPFTACDSEGLAVGHDDGGSFSAEHGIGSAKRELLTRYSAPSRIDLMRAIKQAVDPGGLMNPGKIFQ